MLVVKIGGGKTINLDYIIDDLKQLKDRYVVVHGGNYVLDEVLRKLGIEKKMLVSPDGQISRYTNQEVIDCLLMAYAGYMNKTIVAGMQKAGINAIGLSGIDGRVVVGKRHTAILAVADGKKKVIRDDMTGVVTGVDGDFLRKLQSMGFVPVLTPPILAEEHKMINVDGDKIALEVAAALGAERLVFLIEAGGFLRDVGDAASVISRIQKDEIAGYLDDAARGRMKKKLLVSKWALERGVKYVHIADGRVEHPILGAMEGRGTVIC